MKELIKERKYALLAECQYFDSKGQLQTATEVNMFALKMCDADKLMILIRADQNFEALSFLCEKGYISPISEGKIKIDSLDFRAATILLEEYSMSFLDISPFLLKK